MRSIFKILFLASALSSVGCANESLKRTAYQTMQNAGQQECEKNPSASCRNDSSYDQYQRERQRLNTPASP